MYLYNYSGLKSRDTKIYSIGGYNVAGGFSVQFLTVVGPVFLLALIIGIIISIITGISYNPLSENFSIALVVLTLIFGIGGGCILWYVQFSGYRLYQYLIAYCKPKKVYTNDFKATEYKHTTISIKTFIKNIL